MDAVSTLWLDFTKGGRNLLLCALVGIGIACGATATVAQESVSCVQTYLTQAGYPVGPVDGILGKNTTALGNEFASHYPELALPELSKATADEWCSRLDEPLGRAVLVTRALPEANAPQATIGRRGGLNFGHALVKENFGGVDGLIHGYEKSFWPGRVTVDTDPTRVRAGSGSIRMHLLPGDCGWSSHRGEGEWNDCQHRNERVDINFGPTGVGEMFYGLSLMLDANIVELSPFENPWAKNEINLFQWFQFDSGACFNVQFNTELKRLNIDVRCPGGFMEDAYNKVLLTDSRTDVWHEFVFHANWATDETGFFRVLQNGKMVMAYTGPTIVKAGRPLIADHPQIYAYGSGDGSGGPDDRAASVQYRTPVTVWFDDIVRSKRLSDIQKRYTFDVAALADFDAALPISDLHPDLRNGEGPFAVMSPSPPLFTEGEVDRLPPGAIAPGDALPSSVVQGFVDPARARLSNAKAYGLTLVPDPIGGSDPTLRFELRPGDCGAERGGGWDDCARGQESVLGVSGTAMRDGEHYTLAWKVLIEGPRWGYSPGTVVLFEVGQPVYDDRLMISGNGLEFQRGNNQPAFLKFTTGVFDVWDEFVLDVLWSSGSDGRMSLTMNGLKVLDYRGVTLPEGEARPIFGIRRDGFKEITSVVYFKDVVLTKVDD